MNRTVAVLLVVLTGAAAHAMGDILLVTGVILCTPLGTTVDVGSLPMAMIASPDCRLAVVSNVGFRQFLTAVERPTSRFALRTASSSG